MEKPVREDPYHTRAEPVDRTPKNQNRNRSVISQGSRGSTESNMERRKKSIEEINLQRVELQASYDKLTDSLQAL